jgi:hypothetical protein
VRGDLLRACVDLEYIKEYQIKIEGVRAGDGRRPARALQTLRGSFQVRIESARNLPKMDKFGSLLKDLYIHPLEPAQYIYIF